MVNNMIGSVRVTPLRLGIVLLALETLCCAIIIAKVNYTEIDWKAYIQEVEGYLSGERNYLNLKGDTGPCVYPAGFLYVFTSLYYATNRGLDILTAQIIFAGIYLCNLSLVIYLYASSYRSNSENSISEKQSWSMRSTENTLMSLMQSLPSQLLSSEPLRAVPIWAYLALCLSKRIHSIFVLRMFNDTVAVMFGYAAMALFIRHRWRAGCAVYSLAVSIKMNMLLYAPGLLFLLILQSNYSMSETAICLCICAGVQVVLGLPFLVEYPVEYVTRAFDLKRQFMYKWTVNLKFLPEDIFLSQEVSIGLLVATVAVFALFARKWVTAVGGAAHDGASNSIGGKPQRNVELPLPLSQSIIRPQLLSSHFILAVLFSSNFIGVTFARTLHYQFYSWYFHQIPFLLYHAGIPGYLSLALLAAIEGCFLMYPATFLSSATLTAAHLFILLRLYTAPLPEFSLEVSAKVE